MSSFGTKNHNHHHHHHHHPQLRRQKTCFEVGSINSTKMRDNSTSLIAASGTKRGLCLQRQLSVDATSVIVNPSKFVSAYEKNNLISNSANDLTWKCGSNTSINDRDHHASPKSSAVPIIKKRSSTQSTSNNNNNNSNNNSNNNNNNSNNNNKITEPEITDRHKKALKDRGNRLNLNIFLSHSTNSQDGDINGSDAESSNESMTIVNKENSNLVTKLDVQSNCYKTSESNSINSSNSNISNDSDNNSNQVPVKKIPDGNAAGIKPANSRRPPLVRAMSAPIRPKNDDSSSSAAAAGGNDSTAKVIQVKRKLKKKKTVVSRDSRDDILVEEKFDENDNELDDVSNSSDSTSNLLVSSATNLSTSGSTNSSNSSSNNNSSNDLKKQMKPVKKPALQRPRSAAVGNEVVTLVSLLSSGGSDSEKEDNHTALPAAGSATATTASNKSDVIDFNIRHRAPMLRKSGKSVSFQERDLLPEIPSSTRDYSKYRRGSIAPIAARIRSNRPPTAPAGSIYLCDIDINNDDFMKSIKSTANNRFFSSNSNYDIDADSVNNNKRNGNRTAANDTKAADDVEEIEITYPENVRTPKEKECWKLYQKMLNRGVTVAYDTILRGMLTPTELRIIQKQNESRRNFDTQPSVCDGDDSNTATTIENTIRDGNVNITNNNNNSHVSSSNLNELDND